MSQGSEDFNQFFNALRDTVESKGGTVDSLWNLAKTGERGAAMVIRKAVRDVGTAYGWSAPRIEALFRSIPERMDRHSIAVAAARARLDKLREGSGRLISGAGEGVQNLLYQADIAKANLIKSVADFQSQMGVQGELDLEDPTTAALREYFSDDLIVREGGSPGDFPKKYAKELGVEVPRGAFSDSDLRDIYKYEDARSNDETKFVGGSTTKKALAELESFRNSPEMAQYLVGGDPRMVSDRTPSGYPSSRYGAGGSINTALRDEDWNAAYLEARTLGLSDFDAKKLARMKVGQDPMKTVDTEMTDLRRALTAQAAEINPAILDAYRVRNNNEIPFEVNNVVRPAREAAPYNWTPSGDIDIPEYQKYLAGTAPQSNVAAGPTGQSTASTEPGIDPPVDTPKNVGSRNRRNAMRWGPGHTAASLLGGLAGLYGLSEIYDYDE